MPTPKRSGQDRLSKGTSPPGAGRRGSLGDTVFHGVVLVGAGAVVVYFSALFVFLVYKSVPTISKYGLGYLTGSTFDPVHEVFGVLPMVYGSLMTTAIALLLGVPVSLGVAIFSAELSPPRIRGALSFIVELLAAVPSVVYGLWALLILAPLLKEYVYPALQAHLGFLPIFQGTIFGVSVLTAGIILAVMIIPIVASISRDSMVAVPSSQREAAYALGMTRSEAIRTGVLGYARSGIVASIFLGFGRAFGETMAVKMVIGNAPQISSSLLAPGATLASLIANDFTEANTALFTDALVEAGLVLLLIAFLSNVLARLFIRRLFKEGAELI